MRAKRGFATAIAVLSLVAGCVPAPRPLPTAAAIAPPTSWRDAPTGDGEIDPRWWRAYGDPSLDALVDAALANNTDVLTAIAKLEELRAEFRLTRGDLFPQVYAIGDAQFAQQPGSGASGGMGQGSGVTETFQVGGLSTWQIDLFHRIGALTEAARRRYVASQADRDATALMVAQQTVTTYIGLVASDAQVQLLRDTLVSRKRTLDVEHDRFDHGYDSRQELLQAQGEYDAVAAQLPAQLLSQRRQENELARLTGALPQPVSRSRSLLALRQPVVPATLPSQLVRRRPDIAAAEYRLAAADATITARRAEFLPQITLTAEALGVFASAAKFKPALLWSIGNSLIEPLIRLPLFEGGKLTANFDVATAQRDQAAYAYKAAVIGAFQDVENGLSGEVRLREQLTARRQQIATARQSLAVLNDRFREGYTDFLSVLDAQRTLLSSEQAAISALSDELTNIASLAAALGGGWDRAAAGTPRYRQINPGGKQ